MKRHRLVFLFLTAQLLCCGAATCQQQNQSLWSDYQKLYRAIAPAPVFLPHASFWRFALAPEKPDQLQQQVQELAEAAARQHDVRLQARALILQAYLPTNEQPAALHELRTARQLSQSISDDEGTALSQLGEAYRAYRAGDELSSRAHLYKAQLLYSSQQSVEGQLRCLSLYHLLGMPLIRPGDLFSSDRDDAALAAKMLAIFSGTKTDGAEGKINLLSTSWQKHRKEARENTAKATDGWIMLFDAYQQYQAGHQADAAQLWRELGQSREDDALLRGLSWLGIAQIEAEKVKDNKDNSDSKKQDGRAVHDALSKARQAFSSAQITGGLAQAELLGSQVDFLLHHEGDARNQLQQARKLFEDMRSRPGILETTLISAAGENSIGNSAGALASLGAARKSLGTVAGGAALHGQLLRVPLDDVQRLVEFYNQDSKSLPIEQQLSEAYSFRAWASATEDPLLKVVAAGELSDALIRGGYFNDYLYYATEKEELLQRYTQRVPLALRLQKAALLEYDFLRKSRLIESKTEPITNFDTSLLIDVYVASLRATRANAFEALHEDASKHEAELQEWIADMRKLAGECEAARQAFLKASSTDPQQAVRVLGQFINNLKALFDYLNEADVLGKVNDTDKKMNDTMTSPGKPGSPEVKVKVEAEAHISLVALYLKRTKIEMLQESSFLDFVRDVLSAAMTGNEALATEAANNLASFYELYHDQLSAPAGLMLPFSFLKGGGIGALDDMENQRFAARQKELKEALKQYQRDHMRQVVNKATQQHLQAVMDKELYELMSIPRVGQNDLLTRAFEHVKERERPDQTEVTTRQEGEVQVFTIKHRHSAWFQISPKSEYFHIEATKSPFDPATEIAVLRSAQDPYLVPANPGLNNLLNALNAGTVDQLMFTSMTGTTVQKAVQSASTFTRTIQAGQVAFSMQGSNDFIPQPGSRTAAEWKSLVKESPMSSKLSSLLSEMQLAVVPENPAVEGDPTQALNGFFDKLGKVISKMYNEPASATDKDEDDKDEDNDVNGIAREIGQMPELATLLQYPSLLLLVKGDRENSQKMAAALQARLPRKSAADDSGLVRLDQQITIWMNSALFDIATGSYQQATADLKAALALTGDSKPSEAFQFHYLLAMCARRSHDAEGTLKELQSSVEELERLRSSLTTRSLALALQPVRQMIYEEYLTLAMARGDSRAMLAALQQYKKSTQIPVAALLQANTASADVASQVDEITALYDLESRQAIETGPDFSSWLLDLMAESFKGNKPQVEPPEVALSTLNNVANVLINQIQPIRLHPSLSHDEPKYNLRQNELAIVYFAGSRGLFAVTVDEAGTRRVHYVAINSQTLSQLCKKLRAQIVAREDVSKTAADLYRITLGNIPELAGKTRLKIWPDGPLQFVPFQALKALPDGNYLVQSYVISYITGVAVAPSPQADDASRQLLLVGNPDGTLSAAEDEVNNISRLPGFKSVPLIEREATLQKLQHNIAAAGVVHFATHARANEVQPNFSFLQLAPYDRLYSIDLGGMRFAGKQVFLSACETRVGEYMPGEDIYGISDVFLAAGASSVVATLWRVESQSSALFAERYYPAWQADKDGAAALAQVARDFIEGRSYLERNGDIVTLKDPVYWAGFNRMEPWSTLTTK